MTTHLPECCLAQPCRSNGGKEHVMQGTIAGFPVTICGLCMNDCICTPLHACEIRVELEQMEHLASHRDEWIRDGIHVARAIVASFLYTVDDDVEAILNAIDVRLTEEIDG